MINYQYELIQGTEEWYAARQGILTASEMKHILTPAKLDYTQNDKERDHLFELAAQKYNKYVEPSYIGDHMLRGKDDEFDAVLKYNQECAEVTDCGFITNDKWGFTLGYSPDGLVGQDGSIEVKSRLQKFQLRSIVKDEMPEDFILQVQTGLLVSERKWCDFVSYCGGMPMFVKRIFPDAEIQRAIVEAATMFNSMLDAIVAKYKERLIDKTMRLFPTERRILQEITL